MSAYAHLFTNAQNQTGFAHTYDTLVLFLGCWKFVAEMIRSTFPRCDFHWEFLCLVHFLRLPWLCHGMTQRSRATDSYWLILPLATVLSPSGRQRETWDGWVTWAGSQLNKWQNQDCLFGPVQVYRARAFHSAPAPSLVSNHNVMNYGYKKTRPLFTICHG